MDARGSATIAVCALAAACAVAPYSAFPVDVAGGLPPDAFATCRGVLRREFGELEFVDEERFLLRTGWAPVADPEGERRAAVFRDERGGLGVVVELRRVSEPFVGVPAWTEPRGWDVGERDLARQLEAALTASIVGR